MYTSTALLDIHTRMQRNLQVLLEHCATLSGEQLHQPLDGFGFPTVQLQFFHTILTERFWIGVLRRVPEEQFRRGDFATVPQLEELRREVAELTANYLASANELELSTRQRFEVDPGDFADLVPAHVFLRVLTHQYHHQGQVLAMCRLLGNPRSDELPVDFPLD